VKRLRSWLRARFGYWVATAAELDRVELLSRKDYADWKADR
jgi:hypothetical protein